MTLYEILGVMAGAAVIAVLVIRKGKGEKDADGVVVQKAASKKEPVDMFPVDAQDVFVREFMGVGIYRQPNNMLVYPGARKSFKAMHQVENSIRNRKNQGSL